jgi:hypothetical protein
VSEVGTRKLYGYPEIGWQNAQQAAHSVLRRPALRGRGAATKQAGKKDGPERSVLSKPGRGRSFGLGLAIGAGLGTLIGLGFAAPLSEASGQFGVTRAYKQDFLSAPPRVIEARGWIEPTTSAGEVASQPQQPWQPLNASTGETLTLQHNGETTRAFRGMGRG